MNQETDSTKIYTRRMLSNMDMANRTAGELRKTFTKEYEKDANDLDKFKKKIKLLKSMNKNK
jgi:hypothetical protein